MKLTVQDQIGSGENFATGSNESTSGNLSAAVDVIIGSGQSTTTSNSDQNGSGESSATVSDDSTSGSSTQLTSSTAFAGHVIKHGRKNYFSSGRMDQYLHNFQPDLTQGWFWTIVDYCTLFSKQIRFPLYIY